MCKTATPRQNENGRGNGTLKVALSCPFFVAEVEHERERQNPHRNAIQTLEERRGPLAAMQRQLPTASACLRDHLKTAYDCVHDVCTWPSRCTHGAVAVVFRAQPSCTHIPWDAWRILRSSMLSQRRKGTDSSRTQSAANPINRSEVLRRYQVRDSLNSQRGGESGHWEERVSLM